MKKIFIVLLILLGLYSCGENVKTNQKQQTKTENFAFSKDTELQIKDSLGETIAKFNIELATDAYKRETGLMYRKSMKPENAMLFIFEKEKPLYFYMKNTYIPLDIIYINTQKRIVSIAKNALPLDETTLPSNYPAKYVLEVNAGLADQLGIVPGLKVDWK
jgi:uncharacterized membrane protein (UPF0127 family)